MSDAATCLPQPSDRGSVKIAVVHDWLVDWAGSERVVEQILACYPTADLYSLVDFLEPQHRARLRGKRAATTFLQRMPLVRSRLAYYLPLMPFAIEQLDLSGYDLVISSTHAVAKGVITGPDQRHIAYVHSPMRYAWDLQHEYLRGSAGRGLKGLALRWLLHYLRLWDARTAAGVDAFIANSDFVARRIRKTYGRDARVIYPPVDVERFAVREAKEDFYICVGRLMQYKRVDLVVEAFRQLPDRRLVVLGDGPELRALKKMAAANVTFTGYQPDDVLHDHMQRARALIFAGTEDFGITPLEAQACGTPVIAYRRGGLAETVRPLGSTEPTGVLFEEQTASAITAAVAAFENDSAAIQPRACRKNAERFSSDRFRKEFADFAGQALAGTTTPRVLGSQRVRQ